MQMKCRNADRFDSAPPERRVRARIASSSHATRARCRVWPRPRRYSDLPMSARTDDQRRARRARRDPDPFDALAGEAGQLPDLPDLRDLTGDQTRQNPVDPPDPPEPGWSARLSAFAEAPADRRSLGGGWSAESPGRLKGSPPSALRPRGAAAQLLQRLEEVGQQERLEPVAADRDDLVLPRVQRDAGGAGETDARALDDRAGRDVAVVVRTVDRDESHLIEAPRVAVIVL